ncbi:MAG: hypothetical protein ACTHPD_16725 [Rhizomicrobium sp.]
MIGLVVFLAAANADAPSRYDEVMRAQYAAQAAPSAQSPDEAQRIYEAYLKSIGQAVKTAPTDSAGDAGPPPR